PAQLVWCDHLADRSPDDGRDCVAGACEGEDEIREGKVRGEAKEGRRQPIEGDAEQQDGALAVNIAAHREDQARDDGADRLRRGEQAITARVETEYVGGD